MGCASSHRPVDIELGQTPGGAVNIFGQDFVVPQGPLTLRLRKKAWSIGCSKQEELAAQPNSEFDVLSCEDGEPLFRILGRPLSVHPEVSAKDLCDVEGNPIFRMTLGPLTHPANMDTVFAPGAEGGELFALASNFASRAPCKSAWTQDLKDSSGNALRLEAQLKITGVAPSGVVLIGEASAGGTPVAKLCSERAYKGKVPRGQETVNASEHDVYILEIAPGMDAAAVLAMVMAFEQYEVLTSDLHYNLSMRAILDTNAIRGNKTIDVQHQRKIVTC